MVGWQLGVWLLGVLAPAACLEHVGERGPRSAMVATPVLVVNNQPPGPSCGQPLMPNMTDCCFPACCCHVALLAVLVSPCVCSVAFVVRTAVEQHNSHAMTLLFDQPAVQSMGARAIAGLLQTAIRYKNVPAVLQLSKLEAAHDINTAYLSYLLEEATALGHAGAVQSLSLLQGHQTGV